MRPDWNRIKTFFVPDKLIRNGETPGDAPIQSVKDFPLEKAVVFPSRFWIPHHKRNLNKMFRKRKLIYPNTVTVGFHILSILGYNDFYILGNDGGVGYAEGIPYPKENEHAVKTRNRNIKRIVLEYVIRLLSKRYKLKVRFWQLEDEKGLKIALLCPMRIGSQRLRDKLLQNISLAERAMIIMKEIEKRNKNVVAIAAVGETELIQLAKKHKVQIFERNQDSLKTDEWKVRWKDWSKRLRERGFDFIIIYISCMPFISKEEFQKSIDFLNTTKRQFIWVLENRGVIWDESLKRIHPKNIAWNNTKTNDPYYTYSSSLSAWKPEFYDDFNNLYKDSDFFVVKKDMKYFDIDTLQDLEIARAYFSTLSRAEKKKSFFI